ncbi:MAG TPA: cytochrome c [Xanthobacteraceae bacterium]|nr:cytochrome c [Xanthobacteraceae bacterium]
MRRVLLAVLILALVGAAGFWFLTRPETISASALAPHTPNLENGKVMFFAGGCVACHQTPKQDDRMRLGGGMELKSPYGSFYPPNISPDPKDGIGAWNEAQFLTAMLKGTSPDGRHYFPSFPYASYQRMTQADLRDMFAFIKTLPPVQGRVRDHDIRFPFNVRLALGGWKFLYLDGRPFTPDPNQPAQWNRGAYLVNGPAHCAECHSPRTLLGGIVDEKRFAGGPNPDGEGTIPNITQHALGEYSVKDIERILETGETPEDTVGGSMLPVVRNTSQLPQSDRAAMAAYIKSLPPAQ